MDDNVWLRCSACKKDIRYNATHWVCSVSTCNRSRTKLVFCSVICWDSHVAILRHRDSWAVEARAPTRDAWAAEVAAEDAAGGPVTRQPPVRSVSPTPARPAASGNPASGNPTPQRPMPERPPTPSPTATPPSGPVPAAQRYTPDRPPPSSTPTVRPAPTPAGSAYVRTPPPAPPAPAPAAPAFVRPAHTPSPSPAAPAVPGPVTLSSTFDRDVLIVVSKMKKYIKDRSGMNCSDSVADMLSEHVRAICDDSIRAAGADGRKTVLDRDVPKPRR